MVIEKIDSIGLDFIANEEGMVLHPYYDSVHIPTIGIGSTYYENGERVKITDPAITKERAFELFKNILDHYEKAVWSSTIDTINQNQFNALVSLSYNIGIRGFKGSTVLRRINESASDRQIREGFLMWRNAGGKPVLLERREREAELYFT